MIPASAGPRRKSTPGINSRKSSRNLRKPSRNVCLPLTTAAMSSSAKRRTIANLLDLEGVLGHFSSALCCTTPASWTPSDWRALDIPGARPRRLPLHRGGAGVERCRVAEDVPTGRRPGSDGRHPSFRRPRIRDRLSRLSYVVCFETRSQFPDLVHCRPRFAVWQPAAQSDLQMESQVVTSKIVG
jgi:hypothetical protein